MILLATPISNLFNDSDSAREIMLVSDCLECRDRSLNSDYPKQYLMHLERSLFHKWSDLDRGQLSAAIRSKPELKLLSFHLSSSYPEAVVVGHSFQAKGDRYSRQELFDNAGENIAWLRANLGQTTGIAVENNNYFSTPAYDLISDGEFISELVEDNHINFVFDVAHAMITAHNKKIVYAEYCHSLPLSACVQIHISGYKIDDQGIAYDAHELPDETILGKAQALIDHYPVRYLTIEYYKDKAKLLQLLAKCRSLRSVLVSG